MSAGVVYFNRGRGCLIRILVSISSLRKWSQLPVAVLDEEDSTPDWFESALANLNGKRIKIEKGHRNILVRKSAVWRDSPFDRTMFLDADTLVKGPVDEFFRWIEENGLVVSNFCEWKTGGRKMSARIRQWHKIDPGLTKAALSYGHAVNTGIMGWVKGSPAMAEYERLTLLGFEKNGRSKTLDEVAMQIVLPRFRHKLASHEWNVSPVFGDHTTAKVMHYHGNKHTRNTENCAVWKAQWFETEKALGLPSPTGDRTLDHWRRGIDGRRKDMTIVSAVSPEYAERAERNLNLWLATPGLKDQRFVIFVRGFRSSSDRRFLDRPNVTVIRWNYDHPGANGRETMLAAFVLGVAAHVKTDYWMKLDADSYPVRPWWEWPEYQKFTITSHRWGYSKMKGDPGAKDHWFNRLDAIFSPSKPLFRRRFDPVADFKVRHGRAGIPERFASYAHIEKTEFTRRMAKEVIEKNGGRMPIPSQDTLSWYFSALWKEPVALVNMRNWFAPR